MPRRPNEFDALRHYLSEVRSLPRLGDDEESMLAVSARSGSVLAKQSLIRHHLWLPVLVATKQTRGTVPLADLIQEGNLGLMRAVEKFDPHCGYRFATYATWWVRAYVGRYLKHARSSVRPRSGDVAQDDLSLDEPIASGARSVRLERLTDDRAGPEDVCASLETERSVRTALSRVRRRVGDLGWDIIHSRWQADVPQTLEQIGKRWGISRERVRQVEAMLSTFVQQYLTREVDWIGSTKTS